ncbi:MAG TPA: hypothetical protein VH814_18275 [Steroidobacteraceae bacterium]|jgi:hypothetical protein
MNIRWHGALCVLAFALPAGSSCAEDVIACKVDDPTNCKRASEWAAEAAAKDAEDRKFAAALPFDYRDLVAALVVEFIRTSSFPGKDHQYFVGVFGEDLDSALAAKLHASGINALPASARKVPGENEHPVHASPLISIGVGDIKQIDADTFTIRLGYHCGSLCAGSTQYTMRRVDGEWRVVDRQQDWVA